MIDARTKDLLRKHVELVIEANKTTNITRITSVEDAELLHVEDSLTGLEEINDAPVGVYGDMGSGAGFPGIPIALATGRQTMLIESVRKKAQLLSSFVDQLGLTDQITVYPGRVEELSLERPGSFSVISARALSQLPSLMELAAPLLSYGGRLVCYKARIETDEFDHACSLQQKLGLSLKSDRLLVLGDDKTFRRIIVFEKTGDASVKLPRRPGMAQKRPY